ncbi:hypothetical protein BG452_18280 [Streptomyces sp. CBMA123]|nr:hypothetical protein [Streptomyces sp. CBMA123]
MDQRSSTAACMDMSGRLRVSEVVVIVVVLVTSCVLALTLKESHAGLPLLAESCALGSWLVRRFRLRVLKPAARSSRLA